MGASLGRWLIVSTALLLLHCGTRTGLTLDDVGGPGGGPGGSSNGGPGGSSSGASSGDGGEGDDGGLLPDGAPAHGCGDTRASPANCGACGHDCQGGACVDGVCQPITIADDEQFPETLAVDDHAVYWVNRTDPDYGAPPSAAIVRSMPKRGGTRTTIDTVRPAVPTSLHRDGPYLYFYRSIEWTVTGQAFQGSIVRLCADGSCPRVDLSGAIDDNPWQIAVDSDRIFFPASFVGGLTEIPKAGGAPQILAPYPSFFFNRLAVDDTYVYAIVIPNPFAAKTGTVMLVRSGKTSGSAPETIMKDLVEGGDIAVDAQNLYVSDTKNVFRLAKTGAGALTPVPITPTLKPGYLAMDDARLYWLEYADPFGGLPSTLHWVHKDGSGLGQMNLPTSATAGPGLVVDDTSIYWVATLAVLAPPIPPKGGIMKVVKPL